MSEQDDHALRSTPKLKNIYAWSGSKWPNHQKYKHLLTVMGGFFLCAVIVNRRFILYNFGVLNRYTTDKKKFATPLAWRLGAILLRATFKRYKILKAFTY